MMIIAVVIGVLIAVFILHNPEVVGALLKVFLFGALFLLSLFLVLMMYLTLTRDNSKPAKMMAPVNMTKGVNFSSESINLALSQYAPINKNCPQKVFNPNMGIGFDFSHKKYILVESSCIPEGGNQDFNFINLMEVDAMGRLADKDARPIRGSLKSIDVEGGLINIRYLGYKDTDPKCCPSLPVVDKYEIQDGRLLAK